MSRIEIHEVASLFPAMSPVVYDEVKDDIEKNGLLEPIWLSTDGKIIDGRHRYQACLDLGVKPEFQETELDEEEILDVVVALNLKRRHLTASQRAMVAAQIKPQYEKLAKERQLASLKQGSEVPVLAILPEREQKGGSRDQAAAAVRVSSRMVGYGEKVLEDGVPALVDAVNDGTVSVEDAAKAVKASTADQKAALKRVKKGEAKHLKQALQQIRTEAQIDAIEKAGPADGTFDVVVADPSWPFEARKDDTTQRGRTPYPQMTIDEIKGVTIPAKKDAILWLWVTNSHLVKGYATEVCKAWGFEPKTLYTWVKPKMGTGDWGRSKTEHVVLAVRGDTRLKKVPPTVFTGSVGEHSAKPEEFFKLVEESCAGSKCELFARRKRKGWYCHGAELPEERSLVEWEKKGKNHEGRGGDGRLYKIQQTKQGFNLAHSGNRGSQCGVGAGGAGPFGSVELAMARAEAHEKTRSSAKPEGGKKKAKAKTPKKKKKKTAKTKTRRGK